MRSEVNSVRSTREMKRDNRIFVIVFRKRVSHTMPLHISSLQNYKARFVLMLHITLCL